MSSCVVALCADIGNNAFAQGGVPLWTNRYDGAGHGYDSVGGLAIDSAGSVFVTGTEFNGNEWNYLTLAFTRSGAPFWTNRYSGSTPGGGDAATGIAVDESGRVIVTGYSVNGNPRNRDFVTIAYANSGIPLWTNQFDGGWTNSDTPVAIATDRNGNVFVTGESASTNATTESAYFDYATVAYSRAGAGLWTNRYSGPAHYGNYVSALALDPNGDVIVTGTSPDVSGRTEIATIKYSNGGLPLWTNRYCGPVSSSVVTSAALALDKVGNIFILGTSLNGTNYDHVVIAYSGKGLPIWTNRYGSLGRYAAIDDAGNIFVAGGSSENDVGDYLTLALSNTGVPLWTNRFNGSGSYLDEPRAIAIDGKGNVFVTGRSAATNANPYIYRFATLAYSNTGAPLWTNYYGGPDHLDDGPVAMALDKTGNLVIAGASMGSSSYYDYAIIKYSSSIPSSLAFQRSGKQLVLTWTNTWFNLQSATDCNSPFITIPNAMGSYTNFMTQPQEFFRLISN